MGEYKDAGEKTAPSVSQQQRGAHYYMVRLAE